MIELVEVCEAVTDLGTGREQECDRRPWVAAAGS